MLISNEVLHRETKSMPFAKQEIKVHAEDGII